MNLCHILMKPLKSRESDYSEEGLYRLTGNPRFNPQLPFSRQEFITNKPQKQQGMSISGYQPKLQLIIKDNQFNSVDQQGNYILKPSPEDYPYLAENEHATMRVMIELGFDVPTCELRLAIVISNDAEQLSFKKGTTFVRKTMIY